MVRIGIIAGTGFAPAQRDIIPVETPWGSVDVSHDHDLFFVNRHGSSHLPPHRIVHRANVDALARCKVDAILAVNAVGAIDPMVRVPSLLVPDDLLDLRRSSETFHDERAVHVDMTEPYCPHLRDLLARRADARAGMYAAVEGPRLETRAEVRMLRALGASVVGMTGAPEAGLARERAICYASLCLVVNSAAGVSGVPLRAEDIKAAAAALSGRALDAVRAAAREVRDERACGCRRALDGARM